MPEQRNESSAAKPYGWETYVHGQSFCTACRAVISKSKGHTCNPVKAVFVRAIPEQTGGGFGRGQ